jgi:hypothetical protein
MDRCFVLPKLGVALKSTGFRKKDRSSQLNLKNNFDELNSPYKEISQKLYKINLPLYRQILAFFNVTPSL